ncbi:hypothetical protein [Tuwongella immobilis]|uniref:Repeat-companion domain protein n=1 Tax=Tuwongella immobilis TaxID=692036 RepID=A0A6C2YU79_9BACT|nr:hypothetical protein [Tuwongella immobilis]VIP04897.1 unnamed protein product [Tuwongella immobilis]VTS07153.1 unnamed protein product [Tuwongella immobilis]
MDSPNLVRASLEAALAYDFHDRATHHAYADCLIEAGDPRGEYIRLLLLLEDLNLPYAERQATRERSWAIFRQLERRWLGPMAPFLLDDSANPSDPIDANTEYQAAFSWIRQLRIIRLRPGMCHALATSPALRLMFSLEIDQFDDHLNQEELADFADGDSLANVRIFQLGQPFTTFRSTATSLQPLLQAMPELEQLKLANRIDHAASILNLPWSQLKSLELFCEQPIPLAALTRPTAFPKLERLSIHLVAPSPEPEAPIGGVILPEINPSIPAMESMLEWVRSPQFRQLRGLSIDQWGLGSQLLEAMAFTPPSPLLESLELSNTGVTAAAFERLGNWEGWDALTRISVHGSDISPHSIERPNAPTISVENHWLTVDADDFPILLDLDADDS